MIPAFAWALGYVKSRNGSFRDSTSSDAFLGSFKSSFKSFDLCQSAWMGWTFNHTKCPNRIAVSVRAGHRAHQRRTS